MKVPFIDLNRFEPTLQDRWLGRVTEMSASAQFVGGAELASLESRLSERLEVGHAIGCANGTDALQLALRALGVGQGDVVAVPNATFWATFEAVVNVGAIPVTIDIALSDGGMDINALDDAIRKERLKAVILVHLYGWGSADLMSIRSLCANEGVALVEDGAQCFGSHLDGEPLLKGAQISTTSFYPAKVLGAAGDAGAVFTDDADLAERIRRLGNHGRTAHYGYGDIGWNSRLDALQAAYLNIGLDFLDERIASRRSSADRYREELPGLGIAVMQMPDGYTENGYCNVCMVSDSERKAHIEATLRDRNIGFANIYPGALSTQPGAERFHKAHYGGSNAERLSREVLNLPLFPYMSDAEIDYILESVGGTGA